MKKKIDNRRITSSNFGFTLFELIIVVVILGILTAVIIPIFPNMTDSSKQSNTVANLRSIASAMSMYYVDHNAYPVASNIDGLATLLEPTYMLPTPKKDGWGQEFAVDATAITYTIGSGGKGWDGSSPLTSSPVGPTNTYDSDIIITDGVFTQYPARNTA